MPSQQYFFSPSLLNAKARRDKRVKLSKRRQRGLAQDISWRPLSPLVAKALPKTLKKDVLDKASLTQKLVRASSGKFSVELVDHGMRQPSFSETRSLGLKQRERALIRSVKLLGDGEPWVVARSVIPLKTLRGKTKFLASLGTKPLGGALFKDPSLDRAVFELSQLSAEQLMAFGPLSEQNKFWGRRSVFYIQNKPVLVAEIFLPTCPRLGD